jgi:hypothetical protein
VLSRISRTPERSIMTVAVLAGFLWVYLDFWSLMDIDHKPGAPGAAEFIHERRQPGEPVLVCSPFIYFSMLHHAPDRNGYYLHTDGRPIAHYFGTAALTSNDLMTDERLRVSLSTRHVWAVDMAGGFLGAQWVSVPRQWIEKERQVFPDVFGLGDIIVVKYETVVKDNEKSSGTERCTP